MEVLLGTYFILSTQLNSLCQRIPPNHGDLTAWVEHGVFLLNATLTVEKSKPNSHKDIGWQLFTDRVAFNKKTPCSTQAVKSP